MPGLMFPPMSLATASELRGFLRICDFRFGGNRSCAGLAGRVISESTRGFVLGGVDIRDGGVSYCAGVPRDLVLEASEA
jgi:hypothetical protein